MHVHRAGFAYALIAPGRAEQMLPGQGRVGGLHQRLQQGEFLRCQ